MKQYIIKLANSNEGLEPDYSSRLPVANCFSSQSEFRDLESLVLCLILCCMTLDDTEKTKLNVCLGFERIAFPGFECAWKKMEKEENETYVEG